MANGCTREDDTSDRNCVDVGNDGTRASSNPGRRTDSDSGQRDWSFRGLEPKTIAGGLVFWWFERNGIYTRYEVLELAPGRYEFRVIDPNGAEEVEQFFNHADLAERQKSLERQLAGEGWSGPHGWVI